MSIVVDYTAFETSDGTIVSATLRNVNNASPDAPFVALELMFDNTPINRDLFSKEKVNDILLMIGCKADIPSYPL